MPTTLIAAGHDAAAATAARNWRANRAALMVRQPAVAAALDGCELADRWATARDGSVSAQDAGGRWAAGCSVPRLAGRALLRTLAVEPGGHGLLAPAHAGLLTAARERLGPDAVLFVLQPDPAVVRTMLGCCDASSDIAAGRLWVATGPAWADQLRAAFDDQPGLTTPTRFVRTKLTTDAEVEPIVVEAQRVFGDVAVARAGELDRARVPSADAAGVLVVGGSRFRLWDASAALASAVPGGTAYDTDDPLSASTLALARAARRRAAVVAADVGRGDAADVVAADTPWVTWVTRGVVPPFAAAGPRDAVVVADERWVAVARSAGWPAERVRVGRCPPLARPSGRPTSAVAVVADTGPIAAPESVRDFSSHLLLWEAIEAELRHDPMAARVPEAFLADRARRMGIDPLAVDTALFLTGLIRPAYVQGLARALVAGQVPVQVWGGGWEALPEFGPHWCGVIEEPTAFAAVVNDAAVLVRPVPGEGWHPVEACGRPVVGATRSTAEFVRRAVTVLDAAGVARSPGGSTVAEAIAELIGSAFAA